MTCPIASCPAEVLCEIATWLPVEDQILFGKSCKQVHAAVLTPSSTRVVGNFYFTMTTSSPSFMRVHHFDHRSGTARGHLWSATKMRRYFKDTQEWSTNEYHPCRPIGKVPVKLSMHKTFLFGERKVKNELWRYKLFHGGIDVVNYTKARQYHLPSDERLELERLEDEVPALRKTIRKCEDEQTRLRIEGKEILKELDRRKPGSFNYKLAEGELEDMENDMDKTEEDLYRHRKLLMKLEKRLAYLRRLDEYEALKADRSLSRFSWRKTFFCEASHNGDTMFEIY